MFYVIIHISINIKDLLLFILSLVFNILLHQFLLPLTPRTHQVSFVLSHLIEPLESFNCIYTTQCAETASAVYKMFYVKRNDII